MNIRYIHTRPFVCIAIAFVALLTLATTAVHAYTATEFATDKEWAIGTVMALGDDGHILAASTGTDSYMGVVTGQISDTVEVARTGTVSVLVSDRDGAIGPGTRIGLSDVKGVATTWQPGHLQVGIVKNSPQQWQQIQAAGESKVRVASVEVQLTESVAAAGSTNVFINTVQQIATGVVGHSVDMWRIVTALLIGIGGLILSFGLLFISSRESFFSLGRNPMAGTAIMRGLWKMSAVSVVIMCVSLFGAYLIMRTG